MRRLLYWCGCAAALSSVGALIAFGIFGQAQLWADEAATGGWRLQSNVLTSRCRLVDPEGRLYRRLVGGDCAALAGNLRDRSPKRGKGPLVVMLHGLGRTPGMFRSLEATLRARGYRTLALRYPSLTDSVAGHARRLDRILDGLAGVDRIAFVTHSLGGIVLRQSLAGGPAWRDRRTLAGVVMLGPPNQGSVLARRLMRFAPARSLFGPSLPTLADPALLPPPLPPAIPLAVIAGAGYADANPLIAGEDDGVVGVRETFHPGALFLQVDAWHSFLAQDTHAMQATVRFLATVL